MDSKAECDQLHATRWQRRIDLPQKDRPKIPCGIGVG